MESKRHRAFLTVNYKEGDPSTFTGLTLKYNDKKKVFKTGDPLIDFYNYHKFLHMGKANEEGIAYVIQSSSVITFFMESDDYALRKMALIVDKFVILSEAVEGDDIYDIVIHKDMNSVEELMSYVKSNK